MRGLLGFLLLALLVPQGAAARDIFVDNLNGDDRKGGRTPDSQGADGGPCRTIAKALRIADPSDRVVIANTGTPYREAISIQGARHSGNSSYPFEIIGNGATLDGTVSLDGAKWEHVQGDVFRTRPAKMSFQQLFMDERPVARKRSADSRPAQLAALEWSLSDGWIYFRTEKGRLPQMYALSCCGLQTGITLYDVHDVIVSDLVVRGYFLDGVNAHDNVRRSDLVGLNCRENGRSGISVGGSSRIRIDSCSASGNGAAQFRIEGYSIAQLVANAFDPATAPAILREGGEIVEEKE